MKPLDEDDDFLTAQVLRAIARGLVAKGNPANVSEYSHVVSVDRFAHRAFEISRLLGIEIGLQFDSNECLITVE